MIFKENYFKFLFFLILILIFIQPYILDNYFFNNISFNGGDNLKLKIVGIQPNINQDWIERIENRYSNLDLMINLSNQAINKYNPDLIIWPEYIFTNAIEYDYHLNSIIYSYVNSINSSLIFGGIKLNNINYNNSKRYNSLYILNKKNSSPNYEFSLKIYRAFEPVDLFDTEVIKADIKNDLEEYLVNNISIGLGLCFEENFEYIFYEQIKKNNPGLFIISGNLMYIKNYLGLNLISLSSNLRAAENNRYLFRLETSGISKVINNFGGVEKELPIKKKGILYFEVPIIKKKSFYSENYYLLNLILFSFSIIILIFSLRLCFKKIIT